VKLTAPQRIYAWELQAGDYLVVKMGSIRKAFHVCEILSSDGYNYKVIYNDVRGERVQTEYEANDVVQARFPQ
jgi:hypothetical protein